jgi:hypothetical protein
MGICRVVCLSIQQKEKVQSRDVAMMRMDLGSGLF